MKRTILIGDVHGCRKELELLLAEVCIRPGSDRIIFVGDLINKGPDSAGVMRIFNDLNAEAILGNHEWALIRQARGDWKKGGIHRRMQEEFGADFSSLVDQIEAWPFFIEDDLFTAVHAGLPPGLKPASAPTEALLMMRTWDGKGEDLQNPDNPPWYDLYEDPHPIVFGHWAALRGLRRPNAIGLDTGCAYGGSLTAVSFPDLTFYSVEALETYCPI